MFDILCTYLSEASELMLSVRRVYGVSLLLVFMCGQSCSSKTCDTDGLVVCSSTTIQHGHPTRRACFLGAISKALAVPLMPAFARILLLSWCCPGRKLGFWEHLCDLSA